MRNHISLEEKHQLVFYISFFWLIMSVEQDVTRVHDETVSERNEADNAILVKFDVSILLEISDSSMLAFCLANGQA